MLVLRKFVAVIGLLCLMGAVPGMAQAQGAFPDTVQLGGKTLVMNGSGTRFRAVFRVYDIALYLEKKTQDPKQVMSAPGPKQVRFVALRDIPADQFGLSLINGMRRNVPPEQASEVIRYMNDVIAVFSTAQKIAAGQHFRVDHVPGDGTRMFLDGVQKGPTVTHPEFAAALLSIWMGDDSIDPQLKDSLLSIEREEVRHMN